MMRDRLATTLALLCMIPFVSACPNDFVEAETESGSTGADSGLPTTTIDPTGISTSSTGASSSGTDDSGSESSSEGTGVGGSSSESEGGNVCGDDAAGAGEACDGRDLGGADCASIDGFFGGELSCADDCTFDTSACTLCGNDVLDPAEDETCDGEDFGDEDCLTVEGKFTGGTLTCDDVCVLSSSTCTAFPLPGADALIISEIMVRPSAVAGDDGQWLELFNPSLTQTYQLWGCTLEDGGAQSVTIADNLAINPRSWVSLAPESAGGPGFAPDYAWSGSFSLDASGDTLRLVCNGDTVDEVTFDETAFPSDDGASMSLDTDSHGTATNDVGENWCASTSKYNGDRGTPGELNTSCEGPSYDVSFCRLQWPPMIDALEGDVATVYGRVYAAGLTDMTEFNDLSPNLIGQFGYGPPDTDPAVTEAWTWIDAVPNPGWAGAEMNNDEYWLDMTVPAAGLYDYAFRFTGYGGVVWEFCDFGDPGSSDGYQLDNAGILTSNPAGSATDLYFTEYIEGTGDNHAVEVFHSGTDPVPLTGCSIRIYADGAAAPTLVEPLGGTLEPDATLVVCNAGIEESGACTQLSATFTFDGNDVLALSCGGSLVDVIGRIGEDPGAAWESGGVSTADQTLRRACTVTVGDSDGSDAFDPSVEWSADALDDLTDLGMYVCD